MIQRNEMNTMKDHATQLEGAWNSMADVTAGKGSVSKIFIFLRFSDAKITNFG